MSTALQRKRKQQRRHHHAVYTRPLRRTPESVIVQQVIEPVPTRATCPSCGFRHKTRKDGTLSRHDVFNGQNARECPGTGVFWSTAPVTP